MADEKSAREAMEKSRADVMKCEEEITSIKSSLRSLTMGEGGSTNGLTVSVHKAKKSGEDSDGDAPTPTFKIHLSSPIEERTITKLYDPLAPDNAEGVAKFESVEISNALLTVEVFDGESKLGVSAPHDLLPLCQGGEKKVSTLEVAIVAEKGIDEVAAEETKEESIETPAADGEEGTDADETAQAEGDDNVKEKESESWEDAVEEEASEGAAAGESAKEEAEGDKDAEAEEETEEPAPSKDAEAEKEETKPSPAQDESVSEEAKAEPELQLPLYTLTIELEYVPSPEDRRDALYAQLNEVSKRKVAAIEALRRSAAIVNRARAAEAASALTEKPKEGGGGPAVRSGFLNKPSKAEEKAAAPPFWKRWYEKTIGPKSMLWIVGPIAKNYVVFAGVSLFIHYKGDLLALPPPV